MNAELVHFTQKPFGRKEGRKVGQIGKMTSVMHGVNADNLIESRARELPASSFVHRQTESTPTKTNLIKLIKHHKAPIVLI